MLSDVLSSREGRREELESEVKRERWYSTSATSVKLFASSRFLHC